MLWFIGYCIIALFVARRIFSFMMREDTKSFPLTPPDNFDKIMNSVLSVIASLFWPLALPMYIVMAKPHKSHEEKIAEQSKRIKELERELGIR